MGKRPRRLQEGVMLTSIMAAFEAAQTTTAYNAAKRRAEKLDTIAQLALIDSMIDAHRRVTKGVRS